VGLAAGYGRDQQDAIAFFQGAGFAAQEADVFFVQVDVQELADLAAVVADVAGELGEAGG
jgi:NAD(P)-dependent dehydrogenase (short-subunit alcohol dehydrogenase family)